MSLCSRCGAEEHGENVGCAQAAELRALEETAHAVSQTQEQLSRFGYALERCADALEKIAAHLDVPARLGGLRDTPDTKRGG